MNDPELLKLAARLQRLDPAPLPALPAGLRERVLADARPVPVPAARRPLLPRLRLPAMIAAGAAAMAAVAIALVGGGGGEKGVLEADTSLSGSGGVASVEVREIGIGRTVDLRSDSLKILPKGEYYEVWFVGPGDSAGRPNRISAGTFHPDTKGRSNVQLKAAVDPAKYRRMEVTAEAGDGDPRATGPVVLAARLPLKR